MPEVMEIADDMADRKCHWCKKLIAAGTGVWCWDELFCDIDCELAWRDWVED